MTAHTRLAILPLLAVLITACASQRTLRYEPVPAEVTIDEAGRQAPIAYVYASVDKALREGDDWAIRIRMRLENKTSAPLTLRLDGLRLLDGELTELTMPRIVPRPPRDLAAGSVWTGDVDFPLPPGRGPRHLDLAGLHLHFSLDSASQPDPIPISIAFREVVDPVYDDPYHGRVSIGVHHGF